LDATKGDMLSGDIKSAFSGISIDSRSISVDEVFVAIRGNIYDGFSFAGNIIKQGVRGLLINKDHANSLPYEEWRKKGVVCIAVKDTIKAMGDLARFNRKRTDVSVVAITGSNGKTTTKDMTAAVVARKFCTLSTMGNLNNEIGLPLTLLRLCRCHEWAVLELGMNSPGEIESLADICLPDIGIITNINHSHLEGLGSIEGIMRAKGELLEKIRPDGTAVLNADDRRVVDLANKTSRDVLFYGLSNSAAIRAESVIDKEHGVSFTLVLPSEAVSINLWVFGDFMVSNTLAAAAVGYLLGQSALEIKAGLEDFRPANGRMNILIIGKVHIIDDTYNANPDSMKAAIKTLKSLKGGNRGAIIAGDMLELGEYAESMHKNIGSLFAKSNIAKLYIAGEFAESVAAGAREEDDLLDIFTGTREEILEDLIGWLMPDDWVLIKGSRAMGMEKIVEGLRDYVLSFTLSTS
ncbi:MAG: UDP-N-acetylmuramoyl-tripeptide--D-alanyl-D-alanine ligase, partial [Thermodesulfobacteriota bacterium]|nr:UDP-N-acetylmuramoyl-tripeptide--D-alanyl-D-alanine ligase [Thermodesulfobacteriota bacterium]